MIVFYGGTARHTHLYDATEEELRVVEVPFTEQGMRIERYRLPEGVDATLAFKAISVLIVRVETKDGGTAVDITTGLLRSLKPDDVNIAESDVLIPIIRFPAREMSS